MVSAQASIQTALAARYMVQLCNHFGHRLPTDHDQTSGRIAFPDAPVSLIAREGLLQMTITAPDRTTLDRVKEVMQSHLARFAFRDKPAIVWQDETPTETQMKTEAAE